MASSQYEQKGAGADGRAALALVRALLEVLEKKTVLTPAEVKAIRTAAKNTIPSDANERNAESRKLVVL